VAREQCFKLCEIGGEGTGEIAIKNGCGFFSTERHKVGHRQGGIRVGNLGCEYSRNACRNKGFAQKGKCCSKMFNGSPKHEREVLKSWKSIPRGYKMFLRVGTAAESMRVPVIA